MATRMAEVRRRQQALQPPVRVPRMGETERRDRWWVGPLVSAAGLALFGGYATWAILQGTDYYAHPYLSPFYSPCLAASCPEQIRILGLQFGFSPAILIMGAILGFRATCYYYRKAYYRSYLLDPPACAVGEPWGAGYRGETTFPLILQNLHRYFLYVSIPIIAFLWWDTGHAFFFGNGFGIGVGTLVLLVNVILLTNYLLGCHSLRHLIGGRRRPVVGLTHDAAHPSEVPGHRRSAGAETRDVPERSANPLGEPSGAAPGRLLGRLLAGRLLGGGLLGGLLRRLLSTGLLGGRWLLTRVGERDRFLRGFQGVL
jgi:hypothetical protein